MTGEPPRVDEFYYRPTIDWGQAAGIPARTDGGQQFQDVLLEDLADQGVGSVVLRNTDDTMKAGIKGDVLVNMDGVGLRYSDADFDPAKKDLANLLAGTAATAVGTGAMLGSDDADASILSAAAKNEGRRRVAAYKRRRNVKQDQFRGLKESIYAALDRADIPQQFMFGMSRFGQDMARGLPIMEAAENGLRAAIQPVEQSAYQVGERVLDATGSPAAAAAIVAANVMSPL